MTNSTSTDPIGPGERLRNARISAGYRSVAEAAREHGFHKQNLADHEAGRRGIQTKHARDYGKAFNVSPSWILTGERPRGDKELDVTFEVTDGGRVSARLATAKPIKVWASAPAPPSAQAAVIATDDLYPVLRRGQVVVWWERRTHVAPLVGHECLVATDDQVLICSLEPSAVKGAYTLAPIVGGRPPERDVDVEWAAPIEIVLRWPARNP